MQRERGGEREWGRERGRERQGERERPQVGNCGCRTKPPFVSKSELPQVSLWFPLLSLGAGQIVALWV